MPNKIRLQSTLFLMPGDIQYPDSSASTKMARNMINRMHTETKLQNIQISNRTWKVIRIGRLYYHHVAYRHSSNQTKSNW
mgnify:CR=1 FL=1